jgi:hypothetical protein
VTAEAVTAERATAEPAPPIVRRRRWRRYRPDLAVVAIVALLGLLALNVLTGVGWPGGPDAELKAGTSQPSLFAATCTSMIRPGEHGECVRQVQALLTESGTTLTVDGNFGVETLRRVAAFQVLAGLPATGRVDNATKRALVAGRVSMRTWSADRVERRIREVFRSAGVGDEAVYVARCHSRLDALWVSLQSDGSRGWGAFDLTDDVLGRYDGTRQVALDPEWNIQAAHWIWAEHRDFREWPACGGPSAGPRAAVKDQVTDSAPRRAKTRWSRTTQTSPPARGGPSSSRGQARAAARPPAPAAGSHSRSCNARPSPARATCPG